MNRKNEPTVTHLKLHLKDLEKTLLDLELEGDQFVVDMENLQQDMEIPEELAKNLKTLDESLDTLDEILDIIIVIPQITIGGRELKKVLETIKQPIHKAKIISADWEPLIKQVLEAITRIKIKIKELDQDMEIKRDKVARFLTLVTQTESCISKLSTGKTKQQQNQGMIQASSNDDKQVQKTHKLLQLVDDSLDRINQEVEQIIEKLKLLAEISRPIERLISELNLITAPLKPVRSALEHTISVPYEKSTKYCKKWGIPYPCGWQVAHATFSVEQVISGLNGIVKPVEQILQKETNAILSPLLKSLHLETRLTSIPKLDLLSPTLQALFGNFTVLPKEVDGLIQKATQLEQEIDTIHHKRNPWLEMQQACIDIKQ